MAVEDLLVVDPRRGEVNAWGGWCIGGVGWALVAALVRPVLVVVRDELAQDGR